jgi:biopolymer transport protein ExbD
MPIKFRCPSCRQTLSVSRRKSGQRVNCPACSSEITVPEIEGLKAAAAAAPLAERDAPPDGISPAEPAFAEPEPAPLPVTPFMQAPAPLPGGQGAEGDEDEEPIRFRRPNIDAGGLDMTPMVDVVFQLLIFFMLTCSFSVQKSLQTQAPEPDEEGAAQAVTINELQEDAIVVEIDAEDHLLVDDEPVANVGVLVDVLTSKMASEQRNEMLIEADYRASHGIVVAVTDAGIEANMQHIRRVSRQAEE